MGNFVPCKDALQISCRHCLVGVRNGETMKDIPQMTASDIINKFGTFDLCVYIILIFVLVLIIRVVQSFFKAFAIRHGEADETRKENEERGNDHNPKLFSQEYNWFEAFYHSFLSNAGHSKIDDYWIPSVIGAIELFVFPFLMVEGAWQIIGAWLVIKTASIWAKWNNLRTPYNRFLLGNLLVLVSSLFLLTRILIK